MQRFHYRTREKALDTIISAQTSETLAAYAEKIREVALKFQYPVANVYAEWSRLHDIGVNTDLWLANGLNHPDKRRHQLTANLIFQSLLPTT